MNPTNSLSLKLKNQLNFDDTISFSLTKKSLDDSEKM